MGWVGLGLLDCWIVCLVCLFGLLVGLFVVCLLSASIECTNQNCRIHLLLQAGCLRSAVGKSENQTRALLPSIDPRKSQEARFSHPGAIPQHLHFLSARQGGPRYISTNSDESVSTIGNRRSVLAEVDHARQGPFFCRLPELSPFVSFLVYLSPQSSSSSFSPSPPRARHSLNHGERQGRRCSSLCTSLQPLSAPQQSARSTVRNRLIQPANGA